jgi:zinc protease
MALRIRLPLFLLRHSSWFAAAALILSTAQAAEVDGMKIERVVSPGGIEAWLVESHANPLIAIRFAFRGGATQDDEGKDGLAYFVSAMMDEGAGELNSIAFQERAQELAMRMDFDAGRDVMLGNVQTLTANRDEVFDLVRLAMAKPRFDQDAVERVRAQILAGLKFDENDPETVASLAWDRLAFHNHPYGRPIKGTLQSISNITRDDLKTYVRRVFARDKLVISVVGDIDAATLGKALDHLFIPSLRRWPTPTRRSDRRARSSRWTCRNRWRSSAIAASRARMPISSQPTCSTT